MRQREVEEIQTACRALNQFVADLEITPDDPHCNLHVGMYHCFLRGDWERGLPSLALGDDKQLQEVAEQELRGAVFSQRPGSPGGPMAGSAARRPG